MTGRPERQSHQDPTTIPPPLPEAEFQEIYAKVPRLTVEVVVRGPGGVLLTKRTSGPCAGLWHIPGGTVRFGETVAAAVSRVASTEVGLELAAGPLLGYIEYPSHYLKGMDAPVGLAFLCRVDGGQVGVANVEHGWFREAPEPMHAEQVDFLAEHGLLISNR